MSDFDASRSAHPCYRVSCPECGAGIGEPCIKYSVVPGGTAMRVAHKRRIAATIRRCDIPCPVHSKMTQIYPPGMTSREIELAEAERRRGPTTRRDWRPSAIKQDRRRGFRLPKKPA